MENGDQKSGIITNLWKILESWARYCRNKLVQDTDLARIEKKNQRADVRMVE